MYCLGKIYYEEGEVELECEDADVILLQEIQL